jgi:hypothetical protein
MKCIDVLRELSPFVDDALDARKATLISRHIDECKDCRTEFKRLELLKKKLGMLEAPATPDFFWPLVKFRISSLPQGTFWHNLLAAVDSLWASIRSIERMWYWTRLVGTAITSVFFVAILSASNPSFVRYAGDSQSSGASLQAMRQQLPASVLRNLGIISKEAQRRPIQPSDPAINYLYLLNFGKSLAREGKDDSFAVVAIVDSSGSAKIGNVLEYPEDESLLYHFNDMISSARCRPASQNGRAIEAPMVLTFNRISVYD